MPRKIEQLVMTLDDANTILGMGNSCRDDGNLRLGEEELCKAIVEHFGDDIDDDHGWLADFIKYLKKETN